jgi:septal ring factor EnvC (AmiA/AmiB activator)
MTLHTDFYPAFLKESHLRPILLSSLLALGVGSAVFGFQEYRYYGQRLAFSELNGAVSDLTQQLEGATEALSSTKTELQSAKEYGKQKNNELYDTRLALEESKKLAQTFNDRLYDANQQIKSLGSQLDATQRSLAESQQARWSLGNQLERTRTTTQLMGQCLADVQPFMEHAPAVYQELQSPAPSWLSGNSGADLGKEDLHTLMNSWQSRNCSRVVPSIASYR